MRRLWSRLDLLLAGTFQAGSGRQGWQGAGGLRGGAAAALLVELRELGRLLLSRSRTCFLCEVGTTVMRPTDAQKADDVVSTGSKQCMKPGGPFQTFPHTLAFLTCHWRTRSSRPMSHGVRPRAAPLTSSFSGGQVRAP